MDDKCSGKNNRGGPRRQLDSPWRHSLGSHGAGAACRRARAEPGRDGPRCPRTDHAVGRPRGRREQVWGLPWRGNVQFPGLAYCVGGKSVYWGGWCPRLTGTDLAAWPPATAAWLNTRYSLVESETVVRAPTSSSATCRPRSRAVTAAAAATPHDHRCRAAPAGRAGQPPISARSALTSTPPAAAGQRHSARRARRPPAVPGTSGPRDRAAHQR